MGIKNKSKFQISGLVLSILISVLLVSICLVLRTELGLEDLFRRILLPLIRILFFVTLGLGIGLTIESTGWTKYLSNLARPVFKFSNLGARCGAAFTSAFFSGITANGILLNFYQEGKISKQQLFLGNFINQFPAFFLHLPSTIFIVLPLVGSAGAIYLLLVFVAVMLRTICFVIYGHFKLNSISEKDVISQGDDKKEQKKILDILQEIRTKLPKRLVKIIQFILPIYIGVFLLQELGFFYFFENILSNSPISRILPVESASLVTISFLADYTSGFATAGALLNSGVLNIKQAVLSLILGNILAAPLRAIRHQLPRYLGIFSPKMGTQLLLLGQGFRIVSLILAGWIYCIQVD